MWGGIWFKILGPQAQIQSMVTILPVEASNISQADALVIVLAYDLRVA